MDVKKAAGESKVMRDMLLKTRSKRCLLYSGRKLSRIFSCSYVESRIVGDKLGYLTDENSKQSVEGVTSSLHAAYSKM